MEHIKIQFPDSDILSVWAAPGSTRVNWTWRHHSVNVQFWGAVHSTLRGGRSLVEWAEYNFDCTDGVLI